MEYDIQKAMLIVAQKHGRNSSKKEVKKDEQPFVENKVYEPEKNEVKKLDSNSLKSLPYTEVEKLLLEQRPHAAYEFIVDNIKNERFSHSILILNCDKDAIRRYLVMERHRFPSVQMFELDMVSNKVVCDYYISLYKNEVLLGGFDNDMLIRYENMIICLERLKEIFTDNEEILKELRNSVAVSGE